MKLICSGNQVIEKFSGCDCLLDGQIKRIEIYTENNSVCIDIHFFMREKSNFENVLFKFVGCKEYNFSYSDEYIFYNVELIKYFHSSDAMYYFSFDPANEKNTISKNDQDYILANNVEAYNVEV